MATKKIGFFYFNRNFEILGFDPEPLKYPAGHSKFCPVMKNVFKNVFVLKSPHDIYLKFQNWDNGSCNLTMESGSSLKDEAFEDFIYIHPVIEQTDDKRPMIQFKLELVFVCDIKDCEIELLPPYMEYRPNLPVRTASAKWNIYNWMRPVQCVVEWMDTTKEIKIKRGDPLCYVRFNTREDVNIKLVKIKNTKEMNDEIIRNSRLKEHIRHYSRFAMMKAGLLRPKKWLK